MIGIKLKPRQEASFRMYGLSLELSIEEKGTLSPETRSENKVPITH